jgi:hypothetical protein
MKKMKLLIPFLLLFGCSKETDFINNKWKLKSTESSSSNPLEPSNFIKLNDYLPASNRLIHEERNELVNALNNSTTYRDRSLSEVMFLYEALVNLDVNHLPIPLNKFKIEYDVFEIKKNNDKIQASSILEGAMKISKKIKSIGHVKRYVGTLDIEPYFESSEIVKIRAAYYTGEPIEGEQTNIKVPLSYQKPYGDENFLGLGALTWGGAQCTNIDPLDNAADDLSGRFYNSGSYGVYASQNPSLYQYVNNQWQFINKNIIDAFSGFTTAVAYDNNPFLQNMWTFVNIHKDNWPLNGVNNSSKSDFYALTKGGITVGIKWIPGPTPKDPQTLEPNEIRPGCEAVHAFSTNQKFEADFLNCHTGNYNELIGGKEYTKKLFWGIGRLIGGGGKQLARNCMTGCEFNDFLTQSEILIKSASPILPSVLYPNKKMVGGEFHPCIFTTSIVKLDETRSRSVNDLAHFIYPSYGNKVNFMKD